MKSGYVAIIGRPNSGKSTLLNNILGHKVSITSPKPQTTRSSIEAIYEDEGRQIIFIDTPGIFGKVEDPVSKKINPIASQVLKRGVDVVLYLIDHTRERKMEENKILGVIRTIDKPKILVINKIDIKEPSYLPHYRFLEEEFDKTIAISGLYRTNINRLLEALSAYLPEGKKLIDDIIRPSPALNMNSKTFVAEIIREKAYLFLRREVPYTLTTIVDDITERKNNLTYIRARIITNDDRYRKMIVGQKGRMIKEIGQATRKELETATNQKIYLDLTVETNPHWYQEFL